MHILLFGCGYVGHRAALRWLEAGHRVTVATRSAQRASKLTDEGLEAIVCDVTKAETLTQLPVADALVYAVGYDRSAEPSILQVYESGLQNVLSAAPKSIERAVYVSSTGVYGDAGGDWVDEQTPPAPQRAGGAASLAAEQVLFASPFALRGVALRLGGIYGPGRVPSIEQLKAGEPLEAPQQGWLNLIHVDDAVAAIDLAINTTVTGVLNVVDDAPVLRGDYYAEVAKLIGAPPPQFVAPPEGSPKAARAKTNRRVSNRRIKSELPIKLIYATFAHGLAEITRSPS